MGGGSHHICCLSSHVLRLLKLFKLLLNHIRSSYKSSQKLFLATIYIHISNKILFCSLRIKNVISIPWISWKYNGKQIKFDSPLLYSPFRLNSFSIIELNTTFLRFDFLQNCPRKYCIAYYYVHIIFLSLMCFRQIFFILF